MKKQILLALTLIFIATFSACGQQTTQTPPEPATSTETVAPPTQTFTPIPTEPSLPPSTTEPAEVVSTEAPVAGVSFLNDVLPIFNDSCNKCHGLEQIKEGLDMTRYETLMAGSFHDIVVVPGNAEESYLIKQLVSGEMPKRGPKLTAEQIQIIIDWVNEGALNN